MHEQRISLGLSLADVASKLYITAQALHHYESGKRKPPFKLIPAWCDAIEVPHWERAKIASLAAGAAEWNDHADSLSTPTAFELARIHAVTTPAWVLSGPAGDILSANDAAERLFPWARPAPESSGQPTNLLEQLFDPRARETVVNWLETTHRMVSMFRVYAPDSSTPERLEAIVENCSAHPEFVQMWNKRLDEETMTRNLVVTKTTSGQRAEWFADSSRSTSPRKAGQQAHDIFTLTPRPAEAVSGIPNVKKQNSHLVLAAAC